MSNNKNSNLEMVTENPKLKSFEVYHMESNEGYNDRYYDGYIEARDINHAINILKNEWISEEYRQDAYTSSIDKTQFNEDTAIIEGISVYYLNGEIITWKEIAELEEKYNKDLGELLEGEIEDLELGYIDHYFELIETENTNED